MSNVLSIDIWSDIACPWCYVGKRRLETALSRFEGRDAVKIVWHAFELDPSAPRVRDTDVPYAQRLAKKYGMDVTQAEQRIAELKSVAAAEGLAFDFDNARPGNTFDAHRLLHLAGERGLQDALNERLLAAYMTEGAAIGEPEVLQRLASDVGLDADEVQALLATDQHASAVRDDEQTASRLGIHGVPCFVIDQRYAVSGAQSPEALLQVLNKVWAERPDIAIEEGQVCGPDGCAQA